MLLPSSQEPDSHRVRSILDFQYFSIMQIPRASLHFFYFFTYPMRTVIWLCRSLSGDAVLVCCHFPQVRMVEGRSTLIRRDSSRVPKTMGDCVQSGSMLNLPDCDLHLYVHPEVQRTIRLKAWHLKLAATARLNHRGHREHGDGKSEQKPDADHADGTRINARLVSSVPSWHAGMSVYHPR